MHESGIADEIFEEASRIAEENGASRIVSIEVRVGDNSSASKEQLEFAFRHLKEHHGCEEIEFNVVEVPSLWKCNTCGREFTVEELVCPDCGVTVSLSQGGDIILQNVTLET